MFSGQDCWHGGRVLPQNTQNGLRPTQNTQKIFRKHGVRTSVYSVCREAASVCSVAKTAGTEGGFYHRMHRMGYARHRTHRRFSESTGFDFSVFSVPRSGFSVFSGQKRLARRRFTTEYTERATPVTEYTEGVETEETWLSVFSVCRRRRVQCVCGGLKLREGLPLRHARSHGMASSILCRAAFC